MNLIQKIGGLRAPLEDRKFEAKRKGNKYEYTDADNKIKIQIAELKKEGEEKEAKYEILHKAYELQKDLEISELAEKTAITHATSPVKKTLNKIQIFDKERKNIIFEHDETANIIMVNGQKLTGEETNRFKWFYHRDMGLNSYVTINLDVLSSYLTLMDK